MYSYEEKMRAVELYLKYGLSAAAVINELEQHIKKNKLPAKDQRVVLSHNNYIMVVVRLSATIRHFRLQSKGGRCLLPDGEHEGGDGACRGRFACPSCGRLRAYRALSPPRSGD